MTLFKKIGHLWNGANDEPLKNKVEFWKRRLAISLNNTFQKIPTTGQLFLLICMVVLVSAYCINLLMVLL